MVKYTNKNAGFTLLELMAVVAIVGIMAAIAAPNFSKMIKNADTRHSAEQFFSMAATAQTKAAKSGRLHFIHVDTANDKIVLFEDTDNNSQLDEDNDTIISQIDLPHNVKMGPADGYQNKALDAPYQFIIPKTPCSFCTTSASKQKGTLAVGPDRELYKVTNDSLSKVEYAYITLVPEDDYDADDPSTRLVVITTIGEVRSWYK